MIVTEQMIIKVLNEVPKYMTILKDSHKLLRMHYHGKDIKEFIHQITGLESVSQLSLRTKYARSNKNLFSSLLSPIDKIFAAKGKNKVYQLPTDAATKEFQEKINKIDNGKSLEGWLQSYWKDKIAADPNGVFLIEKDGNGNPYPTYKSILSIRDYKQKGQKLDYIIFEPYEKIINNKREKFIRVYDDELDKLFQIINNKPVQIDEETYKNELGYVPACIISTIEDTTTDFKKSTIDNEIELANEYFRDNSVKTIYKLTNGYPIFWMYYSQCPVCKGSKEIKGEPCKNCNGTGYAIKKDVSEVIGIKPPSTNEEPKLTPDIAGYVSPPPENLEQMTGELKLLKDLMTFSHWGTIVEKTKNETATGRFIDVQPVYDKLNGYADSLEIIEILLTDYIGAIFYKESYKGCSINYGRRFMIETPDQLLDKYIKAKKDKLNQATLDYLLDQYIQSQFSTDPTILSYYQKLMQLEPWLHWSLEEIPQQFSNTIEYYKKIYFQEWINNTKMSDVINFDIKKLDKSLTDYANIKKESNINLNIKEDGTKEV